MTDDASPLALDLRDVTPRVGDLVGGRQQRDPSSRIDIRRWVQAMDYPNPLHWDEEFAAQTKFGELVAPQSMIVSLDCGHGPAGLCRAHCWQPLDFRRRGMVVL